MSKSISQNTIVKLPAGVNGFAEDKDEAKRIRKEIILPALADHRYVVLDFGDMKYSTQSFMHALLGAALQKYKEPTLDSLEFKNCAPQIKSLIQLVVDYSLGGFAPPSENKVAKPPDHRTAQRPKLDIRKRGIA